MKKLLIVLPIFFMAGFAAAEIPTEISLEESSQMVSPCRYWTRGPAGTNGSVCSSYAMNMQVPEARDLDFKFRQLEDRIRRLEEQLRNQTAE